MFVVVASSVVRTKSAVANTAAAPSAGDTEVRNGAVVSADAAELLTERKFVVLKVKFAFEFSTVHGALPHKLPVSAVVAAVIVSFPVTVKVAPLARVSEVGFNKTCAVSVPKTVYGKTKQRFATEA